MLPLTLLWGIYYGNFSQAWKIAENIIEENWEGHLIENFWNFVEKFSGIFGIILLIFFFKFSDFCWGGRARGECKKILEIFGTF